MTENPDHPRGLVEPEGVHAGSSRAADEDVDGDVRSGGDPDAAPQDTLHPAEELLGPPVQDGPEDGPGQTRSVD